MRPFWYDREWPVERISSNGELWVNWLSQPRGPPQSAKLSLSLGGYIKTEFPPRAPLTTTEIDAVIYAVNDWLVSAKREMWVCLDSLDEVSLNGDHGDELEELLSSLMRAVGELIRLDALHFKLFFRTDLYSALTYVNKDHFSSVKLELHWSREDLAILLGHRLAVLHEGVVPPIQYQTALAWINAVFAWLPERVSMTSMLSSRMGTQM